MKTVELAEGGLLLYDEAFLPAEEADRYFAELRAVASWEQRPGVFGRLQPRLTASYGDAGLVYRYSGTVNEATPWTPTLREIKRRVEEVCEAAGITATGEVVVGGAAQTEFNYCLLNCYRSGADSVGLHADDEPGMGPVIGSLSLGATRTFRIRHNRTKEKRSFPVGNGTLVIMAGTMQQFWKHEVPKTAEPVGERINLTFRTLNV